MHKPEVSRQLAKWAVELGEYDVIFRPATTIKSHVLADFVAEFSPALLPALEQEIRLRNGVEEEGEWTFHVDGSSNVRGAGVGIVLTSSTGNTASRAVRFAQRLIKKFKSCKLTQIPREQNSQADALANLGSTLETHTQMSIPFLVLQWPATLVEPSNEEVSAIEEEETWMTPLVRYLEDDKLPEDRNESRKIKKKAPKYCLSKGNLYRRSFSGPYMRCVTLREAARFLVELHEGDCGSHSSGRSLVLRAKRARYYWPTMAEDTNQKARLCDKCQRHAPVSKLPLENLMSISSPWPFRKWSMDIVGKFPMAPGQKVFLLIVTDYFSKWVEAEVLSKITDLQIRKFIWKHVITWFGVPEKIITDNDPQFTSHNFKEFCKDWGIRLSFATPRHPQSNGQAESTNKIVIDGSYNELNNKFSHLASTVKNLENQFASMNTHQTRQQGSLPGKSDQNPKEAKAITLRSGKQLLPKTLTRDAEKLGEEVAIKLVKKQTSELLRGSVHELEEKKNNKPTCRDSILIWKINRKGQNTNHGQLDPFVLMTGPTLMVIDWESEHRLWQPTTSRSNQDSST
ncbi:PREDICTED: uncharacterized protein LOC106339939 [Brassica oleracea var. oleracea]|uniref:uncharacterized protein LOC106339939 n=1 Tax=Brassica oleracea var. oleracea TaxID=109376 RepID=UPI0006A72804|nr:PREDICTED: uncharacterized protein LOC106339939 [Brassica oleracea var. oleracea]